MFNSPLSSNPYFPDASVALASNSASEVGLASPSVSDQTQAQPPEQIAQLKTDIRAIVHQFNNYLTTIQALSELNLILGSANPGTLQNDLTQIHAAAEQAAQLSRQLHRLVRASC